MVAHEAWGSVHFFVIRCWARSTPDHVQQTIRSKLFHDYWVSLCRTGSARVMFGRGSRDGERVSRVSLVPENINLGCWAWNGTTPCSWSFFASWFFTMHAECRGISIYNLILYIQRCLIAHMQCNYDLIIDLLIFNDSHNEHYRAIIQSILQWAMAI